MKNSTILRDELSIFKADKSAVVAELRLAGQELKKIKTEIDQEEIRWADVQQQIKDDLFRRDNLRAQAKQAKDEFEEYSNGAKNMRSSYETLSVKNAQAEKLHLGRIKDLKRKEEEVIESISRLKENFDKNNFRFSETLKLQEKEIRDNKKIIKETESNIKFVTKVLDEVQSEEKKLTKERLKREDKIRAREKAIEIRESVVEKKEDDLETMANDILLVYGRLKEYYSKVDPTVELDKLIFNAT
jgi:DNA repair exonuclease SbcCD ATPase subunit